MNQQITIYPTVIPGGFTTSRLILIDKTILAEAAKLDYLSLYILAREIAHQYLGFNVESEYDLSVSISDGLAGFLANDYLKNRYEFLQQKYKLSDNQLISFNTKVFNDINPFGIHIPWPWELSNITYTVVINIKK